MNVITVYTDKLARSLYFYYNTCMKKIEKLFIKAGFKHELHTRKGNVAIYKRTQLGSARPHYEVVQIGSHNGYNMGTAYIEPAETYPGNSLWGLRGWTHQDLTAAKYNFDKLVAKELAKREKVA